MTIIASAGTEVYNVDSPPIVARGIAYSDQELADTINGPVAEILRDDNGMTDLAKMLGQIPTTAFASANLEAILTMKVQPEEWRIGEALAEAYLVDQHGCSFPWPGARDLKNPSSSPAGTDLVGFQAVGSSVRFAFGEVKTSEQAAWPPSVVTGRHGLKEQIGDLLDKTAIKDALVKYLGHHATNTHWKPNYIFAASRYLGDPTDVSLFGILIRDVEPKDLDLRAKAKALSKTCPMNTSVELRGIYLPQGSIAKLPRSAADAMGGAA